MPDTGKIEYAPDYKSEFERLSCPKCGGSKPTCCSCPDPDPLTFAIEQVGLRNEVVSAARNWYDSGMGDHIMGSPLADAVRALNDFESQQIKK